MFTTGKSICRKLDAAGFFMIFRTANFFKTDQKDRRSYAMAALDGRYYAHPCFTAA
jgi:hypothetical protein